MPGVQNGFGTEYCGKTNILAREGVCAFCGNSGLLQSYDATQCFVVLFLPLIPLSRKRVLDQCPTCGRSRVISLRQYQAQRDREIGEASRAYQADPNNALHAITLLGLCRKYAVEAPFRATVASIEESLGASPSVQLELGDTLSFFGDADSAERAYQNALRLQESASAHDALALLYLREGRAADAQPHLEPILRSHRADGVPRLLLLIEAFQAEGKHAEALDLIQQTRAEFPDAEAAELERLQVISQENLTAATPVPSSKIEQSWQSPVVRRPWAARAPLLVGPAILLIALGLYVADLITAGQLRKVYLVNGLGRPYAVTVDGQRLTLAPFSALPLSLHEGEIPLESADASLPLPKRKVRIQTPFFLRPFVHRTFVINPDQTAILYEQTNNYSPGPHNNEIAPHTLHVGELLYTFSNIDYPFEDFPQTLEVSEQSGDLVKRRLALLTEGTAQTRLSAVASELGPDVMRAYVQRGALASPDNAALVSAVVADMQPDQAVEFLRPKLAQRPVLVEWHRAYQDAAQRLNRQADLEAEYRRALAAEPDNGALMYLLGRVLPQRAEANKLFLAATQARHPSPYGYLALAFDALCSGNFRSAVDLARKASSGQPRLEAARPLEREALLAANDYDGFLDLLRQEERALPSDGDLVTTEVLICTLAHRPEDAQAAADKFSARFAGNDAEAEKNDWLNYTHAVVSYGLNDTAAYASGLSSLPSNPRWTFYRGVAAEKLDEASVALASMKNATPQDHLTLYIAAMSAGNKSLADDQLAETIDGFKKLGKEYAKAAAALANAPAAQPGDVIAIQVLPPDKRLVLIAMALADPNHRDVYRRAAAPFNYDHVFPFWTLNKVLRPH